MKPLIALALISATAAPAFAEDGVRDFCGDRPGIGTPACTVDAGHLQAEIGIGDWTLDRQPDSRTDSIGVGDVTLRYGITSSTELRFDLTAYNHVRTRDRASGTIDRAAGIGDVTIGIKQNLKNPDGSGFSVALLPYATLPTAKSAIGAGDWGAGLIVPVNYALNNTLSLELTPEIDAAVDGDGHGRHLAYGSVIGLQAKLSEKAGIAAELQAIRDQDPDGHTTQALAGLSFSYLAQAQTQFDIGANAGLNRNSPDIEIYFGIARKF
jgi:hypothetical protein